MDTMPLVSVIMPVYNVEAFLEEAVKSIINQEYLNWELILVDDGSTDKSAEICDEFVKTDKRIRVIHQANQGLSDARNQGIRDARGEYIIFVDSDDSLSSETLAETIQVAESLKLDCVLYEGISFAEDTRQTKAWIKRKERQEYAGSRDGRKVLKAMILNKEYSPSACAYVIKTEILKKTALLFYPGILHEDELFTVQLLLHCDKVGVLYKPYYHRRVRQNSIITDKGNLFSKGRGLITVFCRLSDLYEDYPQDGIEAEILDLRLREILARIFVLYIQSNPSTRRLMKEDMRKVVHAVNGLSRAWAREKEIRQLCRRYKLLSYYYDWRVAPKIKRMERNVKSDE